MTVLLGAGEGIRWIAQRSRASIRAARPGRSAWIGRGAEPRPDAGPDLGIGEHLGGQGQQGGDPCVRPQQHGIFPERPRPGRCWPPRPGRRCGTAARRPPPPSRRLGAGRSRWWPGRTAPPAPAAGPRTRWVDRTPSRRSRTRRQRRGERRPAWHPGSGRAQERAGGGPGVAHGHQAVHHRHAAGAYSRTMSCSPAERSYVVERRARPASARRPRWPAVAASQLGDSRSRRVAESVELTTIASPHVPLSAGSVSTRVRRVVRQGTARARRRSARGTSSAGCSSVRPTVDRWSTGASPSGASQPGHRGPLTARVDHQIGLDAPRPRPGRRRPGGCRPSLVRDQAGHPHTAAYRQTRLRGGHRCQGGLDHRTASGHRVERSSPCWRPPVAEAGCRCSWLTDRPPRASSRVADLGQLVLHHLVPARQGDVDLRNWFTPGRLQSSTPGPRWPAGSAGSRSSTSDPESGAGQHQRGGQTGGSGAEHDDVAYGSARTSCCCRAGSWRLLRGLAMVSRIGCSPTRPARCSLPADHVCVRQVRRGPSGSELDRPQHLDQPVDGSGEMAAVGAERQVEHLRGRLLGWRAGTKVRSSTRRCSAPSRSPASPAMVSRRTAEGGRRVVAPGGTSAVVSSSDSARPPVRLSRRKAPRTAASKSARAQAAAGASARPEAARSPRSARGWPSSRRRPRPGTVADPSRTG